MTDAFPATFFYADLHAKSGTVPFHQHDGCEILLVLRGKCRVESPLGTLEGNAGDLLVIPPGIRHNQLSEPGERNFFCVFRAETGLFRQEWRKIHLAAPGFARRTLLELQTMNLRNERSGADALLCSLLQRISARNLRNFRRLSAPHSNIFSGITPKIFPWKTLRNMRGSVRVFCADSFSGIAERARAVIF